MKLAITLVLGVTAMQFCTTAQAAEWVPLASAGAVDQYFYDRSKLSIKDDEITFWKKVVFSTPQSINGKTVASGLLRERIHCAEHTAKLISYLYYSATGETVEYIAKDESEAAPIIPDTVGDAFEQKLCPMVWRKQDEARIKAEQKAAEAELSALKKDSLKQEKPASPAISPAPPAPEIKAPDATPAPKPVPTQPLPMPQIIEQLY